MEVGRGDGDVAQAGHLEHVAVFLGAGDIEAPQVRRGGVAPGGEVVPQYAELLEHVAADIHPLMASDAAVVLEALVAVLFLGAEDRGVARQVLVETRVEA